ncbi:C-C motif chemokine 25 isoform X2 [Pteropus medius]|nr:C-C motif chemokine 25 isoform X2 [Pteropus giganteus]XP_039713825.1 C-C motif chemokine 25 isoform X2 [Pteropus giganteus]XP_039713830.1 C-C motif chemokine 25 isoform X2 [Pteropus giganteus]XP_039713834.1 C-C motif chemokine 25 isoform X2 [Pteropus giganteus]
MSPHLVEGEKNGIKPGPQKNSSQGSQGEPACAMKLWLLVFLVACFVGTWVPAVHAPGVFEDCCLAYHPHIRLTVLRRAQYYLRQDVSGSCNLPAVIFYFPHRQKMVCGNPRAKWVRDGMKFLNIQKKALPKHHQDTRRNFQDSHSGVKKFSSGTSRLPLYMFRGHTRNSQRNTSHPAAADPGP